MNIKLNWQVTQNGEFMEMGIAFAKVYRDHRTSNVWHYSVNQYSDNGSDVYASGTYDNFKAAKDQAESMIRDMFMVRV